MLYFFCPLKFWFILVYYLIQFYFFIFLAYQFNFYTLFIQNNLLLIFHLN